MPFLFHSRRTTEFESVGLTRECFEAVPFEDSPKPQKRRERLFMQLAVKKKHTKGRAHRSLKDQLIGVAQALPPQIKPNPKLSIPFPEVRQKLRKQNLKKRNLEAPLKIKPQGIVPSDSSDSSSDEAAEKFTSCTPCLVSFDKQQPRFVKNSSQNNSTSDFYDYEEQKRPKNGLIQPEHSTKRIEQRISSTSQQSSNTEDIPTGLNFIADSKKYKSGVSYSKSKTNGFQTKLLSKLLHKRSTACEEDSDYEVIDKTEPGPGNYNLAGKRKIKGTIKQTLFSSSERFIISGPSSPGPCSYEQTSFQAYKENIVPFDSRAPKILSPRNSVPGEYNFTPKNTLYDEVVKRSHPRVKDFFGSNTKRFPKCQVNEAQQKVLDPYINSVAQRSASLGSAVLKMTSSRQVFVPTSLTSQIGPGSYSVTQERQQICNLVREQVPIIRKSDPTASFTTQFNEIKPVHQTSQDESPKKLFKGAILHKSDATLRKQKASKECSPGPNKYEVCPRWQIPSFNAGYGYPQHYLKTPVHSTNIFR